MSNKYSDLRARMSAESQVRAKSKAQAMLAEMPVTESSDENFSSASKDTGSQPTLPAQGEAGVS